MDNRIKQTALCLMLTAVAACAAVPADKGDSDARRYASVQSEVPPALLKAAAEGRAGVLLPAGSRHYRRDGKAGRYWYAGGRRFEKYEEYQAYREAERHDLFTGAERDRAALFAGQRKTGAVKSVGRKAAAVRLPAAKPRAAVKKPPVKAAAKETVPAKPQPAGPVAVMTSAQVLPAAVPLHSVVRNPRR